MKVDFLEQALKKRYNKWGIREPLVGHGQEQMKVIQSAMDNNLSDFAKSYVFANSITGASGLEFVAFSKSKLSRPVQLPNEVILFPCFIETVGKDIREPIIQASMHMEMTGTYIYDGWLPIESTHKAEIDQRLGELRESLATFALISGGSFDWEPKYFYSGHRAPSYFLEDDDLGTLEDIASKLREISSQDKHAILRSISWVSRAQIAHDNVSKFLYSVLAIESLCCYIEQIANETSSLYPLTGFKKSRADRKAEQEIGIKEIIFNMIEDNPIQAVKDAYFTWVVSLKKMLMDHLSRVMGDEDKSVDIFFNKNKETESPALYDIRHKIAHGEISNINESDLLLVDHHVLKIEKLALRYIWRIMNNCLDIYNRRSKMTVSMNMDLNNGILSNRDMYKGPVEMSILYYNRL